MTTMHKLFFAAAIVSAGINVSYASSTALDALKAEISPSVADAVPMPPAKAVAAAGAATADHSKNKGNTAHFIQPAATSAAPVQIRLSRNGGVPYTAQKINSAMASDMSIVLHNVNEAQFNALIYQYSGWSKVKSKAAFGALKGQNGLIKDLPLEYVLPPLMQALIHKTFSEPLMQTKHGNFSTTTNCMATAFEIARQAQSGSSDYELYFVTESDFQAAVDAGGFKHVATVPTQSLISQAASGGAMPLKPGDLLAFEGEGNYILHVVTWIDGNLVFEKPSYDNYMPFAFDTLENMLQHSDKAVILRWDPAGAPIASILQQPIKTPWAFDKDAGIYLNLPNSHVVDPYIIGGMRIEFYGVNYAENGVARLVP